MVKKQTLRQRTGQEGIGHLVLLSIISILILGAIGFAGSRLYKLKSQNETSFSVQNSQTGKAEKVTWSRTNDGWKVSGTPPACPEPLMKLPTDISQATAILYPGQPRNNDFKPHGGFVFGNHKDNKVTVTAPLDAQLAYGVRYIEIGEVQYMFDFINPCGYAYRFDHLKTLDPKLQAIANTLPEPKEGDSRTQGISQDIQFKVGDIIATEVGFSKERLIVGFDWGVYDMRSKNESSKDPAWAAAHDFTNAQHAVCWFDLLNAEDEAKVRALPAGDGRSGKSSDYCKVE